MNGTIQDATIRSQEVTFEDVGVYLYREDGTRIKRIGVGTMEGSTVVSVSADEVPHYVIIYSPDFWTSSWFGLGEPRSSVVTYYVLWDEGSYGGYSAGSKSELPVQPKSAYTNSPTRPTTSTS